MTDLIYLFSDSGFSGIADVVLKKKHLFFQRKDVMKALCKNLMKVSY